MFRMVHGNVRSVQGNDINFRIARRAVGRWYLGPASSPLSDRSHPKLLSQEAYRVIMCSLCQVLYIQGDGQPGVVAWATRCPASQLIEGHASSLTLVLQLRGQLPWGSGGAQDIMCILARFFQSSTILLLVSTTPTPHVRLRDRLRCCVSPSPGLGPEGEEGGFEPAKALIRGLERYPDRCLPILVKAHSIEEN